MKLMQAVAAYVAYKQSLGMRFTTEARTLKSFCRALGDVDIDRIEPEQVRAFLDGAGPMTRFWHRKLDALGGFYRFALARGYACRSPLPTNVPRCAQAFVPYIYSEDEIKRLLDGGRLARTLQPVVIDVSNAAVAALRRGPAHRRGSELGPG